MNAMSLFTLRHTLKETQHQLKTLAIETTEAELKKYLLEASSDVEDAIVSVKKALNIMYGKLNKTTSLHTK